MPLKREEIFMKLRLGSTSQTFLGQDAALLPQVWMLTKWLTKFPAFEFAGNISACVVLQLILMTQVLLFNQRRGMPLAIAGGPRVHEVLQQSRTQQVLASAH